MTATALSNTSARADESLAARNLSYTRRERDLEAGIPEFEQDVVDTLTISSGVIPSFAYTERIKILDDLGVAVTPINRKLERLGAAQKEHWEDWDKKQRGFIRMHAVLYRWLPRWLRWLSTGWALLRYEHSDRRPLSEELHRESIRMHSMDLVAQKNRLIIEAKAKLRLLDQRG
ncbi:hypothetical protein OQA88_1116 [Cercophora sp. LCS_1]